MEAFYVDEALVNAAAAASPSLPAASTTNLHQLVAALPRDVCDDWLLRLAQGQEFNLPLLFQRYLQRGKKSQLAAPGQRTVGDLLAMAEGEAERIRRQKEAEAEAKRIRELEALAPKAEETWTFAQQLIQQGSGRSYDEAVGLLVKLRDLAVHQKTTRVYITRLRQIREKYRRRSALLRRLGEAGLP